MLTRLYFRWIPLFAIVFLALMVAARMVGAGQPLNPALSGFVEGCEDKPQPCWYGIVPGQTTDAEIYRLLAFAGEPEFSRSIFSRDFTLIFTLPPSWPYCRATFEFVRDIAVRGEITVCRQPDIRVGDLTVLLESEEKTVSLPPHELVYGTVGINVDGWPMPYSRVNYIDLRPLNARFQPFPWRGFVSQNRYCHLIPNYPLCS
jgi:hypothetical protein